jgi:integrating conjugative element membrane protein (TIGR03747 family)
MGLILSTFLNVLSLSLIAWFFLFLWFGLRMIHSGAEITVTTLFSLFVKTSAVIEERLIIFIVSLPLWATVLFVMIVDGLVQRDIRKFQAARESTFLFHRLGLLIRHVFYGFFLLYMSLPWQVQSKTFILIMLLTVSVLMMLMVKHYKKYV